jgi:hypothetical protein
VVLTVPNFESKNEGLASDLTLCGL